MLSKPKPPPEALPLSDSDDDLAVPETQIDTTAPTQVPEHDNEALQLEAEAAGNASDNSDNSDSSHQPHAPKKRNPTSKLKAEKLPKAIDVSSKKEGPVKKAAKKISAQANPNFRRLNIKSKNSKGKGGGCRRGGRRR